MAFSSTIQILKLEQSLSKKLNPETGRPYESTVARALLLNDDGEVETLGRLRVPRDLVPLAKIGTFRAAFALTVPDFGESKGEIVAQLVGLTSVPPARVPAASPKA